MNVLPKRGADDMCACYGRPVTPGIGSSPAVMLYRLPCRGLGPCSAVRAPTQIEFAMKKILSILLFVSVSLLGYRSAVAAPVVTITTPVAASIVEDIVSMTGTISSTYTLSSVQAQVAGVSQTLTFTATSFSGSIDISSVPVGPIMLTITATDSLNNTGSASVGLVHDHRPILTVDVAKGFVARPSLRLVASCGDIDLYGCASMAVRVNLDGKVIASTAGASLDETVSLAQYSGKALTLTFSATDTQGLTTTFARDGYVDTNATLVEVARGDGTIFDFDDTRFLFATDNTLVIRSRIGDPDIVVASTAVPRGCLTSHGAIWPGGEWRDGAPLATAATADVVANGDYAAWTTETPGIQVYWRNVATNVTTQIVNGGTAGVGSPSVASNGNLAFVISENIANRGVWRYVGGVLERISTQLYTSAPVTDGINIVYKDRNWDGDGRPATYFFPPSGPVVQLDPNIPGATMRVDASYAVKSGWTAFTKATAGIAIVNTRAPDGTIAEASIVNANSFVDAVSDAGEVVYNAGGRRYKGRAGGPHEDFSDNAQGRIVYRQGWYEMLGQLLLRFDGSGGDGGTSDDAGSTPDATIDTPGPNSDVTNTPDSNGGADATTDVSNPPSDAPSIPDSNGGHADATTDAAIPPLDAGGTSDSGGGGRDAALEGGTNLDASDATAADVATTDVSTDRSGGNGNPDATTSRPDAANDVAQRDGNVVPGDDSSSSATGCAGCSTSSTESDGPKALSALGLLAFAVVARRRRSRPIAANRPQSNAQRDRR